MPDPSDRDRVVGSDLVWTKDAPTVPGCYFVTYGMKRPVVDVGRVEWARGGYLRYYGTRSSWGVDELALDRMNLGAARWAGPIPEPTENTEHEENK